MNERLVLHQFPAAAGAPSLSPFCVKVHWALRLKKLAYETRDTLFANRVAPRGKLPALAIGDELVEDSTAILERLDALAPGEPRLYPVEPEHRAVVDVLEDWGDETLYWYVIHYRWVIDANFARLKHLFFGGQPAALRAVAPIVARRKIVAQARGQGIGRRPAAAVDSEFDHHLTTLDRLLTNHAFLAGNAITAADLAVAAQLVELRLGVSPDAEARIDAHPATRAWIDRVVGACG